MRSPSLPRALMPRPLAPAGPRLLVRGEKLGVDGTLCEVKRWRCVAEVIKSRRSDIYSDLLLRAAQRRNRVHVHLYFRRYWSRAFHTGLAYAPIDPMRYRYYISTCIQNRQRMASSTVCSYRVSPKYKSVQNPKSEAKVYWSGISLPPLPRASHLISRYTPWCQSMTLRPARSEYVESGVPSRPRPLERTTAS